MLGCHEFCGYYEWTFHFVRRKWGQEAVARLWAEAIGGESQAHYTEAARRAGLAGLYQTWVKTGEDESCDWTFTLDETRNVLRWDMRQCPSKGFLLAHDLNADEDYCDHCMGWMVPLLAEVGVEVWQHEHNHLGQCWGTMRMADRPSETLEVKADIRDDPRWKCGYVDRWEQNSKQPLMPERSSAVDSCLLLEEWFARCDRIAVVAEDAGGDVGMHSARPAVAALWKPVSTGILMTDRTYALGPRVAAPPVVAWSPDHATARTEGLPTCGDSSTTREDRDLRSAKWHGQETVPQPVGNRPLGVLIGHESIHLAELAKKYHDTPEASRPLLMHPYLPGRAVLDLTSYRLPRPVPALPLLIRTGHYTHQPGGPEPIPRTLLLALAAALGKEALVLDESDREQ